MTGCKNFLCFGGGFGRNVNGCQKGFAILFANLAFLAVLASITATVMVAVWGQAIWTHLFGIASELDPVLAQVVTIGVAGILLAANMVTRWKCDRGIGLSLLFFVVGSGLLLLVPVLAHGEFSTHVEPYMDILSVVSGVGGFGLSTMAFYDLSKGGEAPQHDAAPEAARTRAQSVPIREQPRKPSRQRASSVPLPGAATERNDSISYHAAQTTYRRPSDVTEASQHDAAPKAAEGRSQASSYASEVAEGAHAPRRSSASHVGRDYTGRLRQSITFKDEMLRQRIKATHAAPDGVTQRSPASEAEDESRPASRSAPSHVPDGVPQRSSVSEVGSEQKKKYKFCMKEKRYVLSSEGKFKMTEARAELENQRLGNKYSRRRVLETLLKACH